MVRTLWGELAWQLGGRAAFERVRADDERATSPGDALRELFNQYGPCLILIDEWVAYARQLHDAADLPAGSFETHFTFAQALTESAKLARQMPGGHQPARVRHARLAPRPGRRRGGGRRARAGGPRPAAQRRRAGRGLLAAGQRRGGLRDRAPAAVRAADRARAVHGARLGGAGLLRPLPHPSRRSSRPSAAKRTMRSASGPPTRSIPRCSTGCTRDWSTLVKFQRTRGVLRLMAAVIHSLWEKGDRNPLILPANLPIDDPRVQFELTRYLSDNWVPVIEKDVDGPNALPLRLDGEVPNLGKYAACRRVARTIYLGSAPTATAANRGLEDRQIKLGCVMPGESAGRLWRRPAPAERRGHLPLPGRRALLVFDPAHGHQDGRGPRRAAQARPRRRGPRGRAAAARRPAQGRAISAASTPCRSPGADVPDDLDARLVVLGIDHPYSKEPGSPAEAAAKAIFEFRGNVPRLYRNTLVFLAVDKTRLQDLDEAVRRYLAWDSILDEKETLDLSPHQVKQAETQRATADSTVTARMPEAYQWLLVPGQATPQSAVEWQAYRLTGQDALAVRASKKLRNDELLVTALAGTRLRMELDRVPLWRGDHVAVRQLVEDFARYLYLPRLQEPAVLLAAIRDGLGLLLWTQDTFAYADSYDEAAGRYRGLRCGPGRPPARIARAGCWCGRKWPEADGGGGSGGGSDVRHARRRWGHRTPPGGGPTPGGRDARRDRHPITTPAAPSAITAPSPSIRRAWAAMPGASPKR